MKDFPDRMTRTRRDHAKLLTLIDSIALLHQHQREIRAGLRAAATRWNTYSRPQPKTWRWRSNSCTRSSCLHFDELPPHTRRYSEVIEQMVKEECERLQIEYFGIPFHAAQRAAIHLSELLQVHLRRLGEEMEYLCEVRYGGPGHRRSSTSLRLPRKGDQIVYYCRGSRGGVRGGPRGGG